MRQPIGSRPARPSLPRTAPPATARTGQGNTDFGAPDLTDQFWIYGGDLQSIFTSVWGGRQGHMPSWEARLSAVDRKILALYLVDLGARSE